MVKFVRWAFRLLVLLMIISCGVKFIFLENKSLVSETCANLRRNFSVMKTAKSLNFEVFTREVSDLLSCPFKPNTTNREVNRLRMKVCCYAKQSLFLTKCNTAVGQKIQYEMNPRHTYTVEEAFHQMLPEDFPWSSGSLRRCAVVGSGGILRNSSCGGEIDDADFVIRFNLAVVNDTDVGLKTDLVTMNPSQFQVEFRDVQKNPGPLVERVSSYGNAILVVSALTFAANSKRSIASLKAIHALRPQQPIAFFSPSYLKSLKSFWKSRGIKSFRLSTGFMLVSAALELCEQVHVYGFWPFDTDLRQNPVPYHYHNQRTVHVGVHDMPQEFLHLLHLHSQGALTLHLLPCSFHT